jgi:hypothetical protein
MLQAVSEDNYGFKNHVLPVVMNIGGDDDDDDDDVMASIVTNGVSTEPDAADCEQSFHVLTERLKKFSVVIDLRMQLHTKVNAVNKTKKQFLRLISWFYQSDGRIK